MTATRTPDGDAADLSRAARAVLDGNWLGRSTKPSPRLYPHQWNWDSGFIALGYATWAPERAVSELAALFDGQWANGMVPHIVFNPDPAALDGYFPGPDFWLTADAPNAPRGVLTSGITQPAVHGLVLQLLLERGVPREALRPLARKVLALHRYFYRERDPERTGLVYIRHPWESGNDNAPTWDRALGRIDPSRLAIPPYTRKDLRHVASADERPTDLDYDRYVHLVDVARRARYDEARIRERLPFLVVDPLFNAVLARSGEALAEAGASLGIDAGEPREQAAGTLAALDGRLWNAARGMYDAYDLVAGERVETPAISGVMPIICAGLAPARARRLVETLEGDGFGGGPDAPFYAYPSCQATAAEFDPHSYWRGPAWINTSWLIHQGLRRHGFARQAAGARADMLELVRRHGFFEYFHPRRDLPAGERGGYGTGDFSWTAALTLDLVTP